MNMLKAASKMLSPPVNKSKVECAKTMIDETILFLEEKAIPSVPYPTGKLVSFDEDLSPEASAAKEDLMVL